MKKIFISIFCIVTTIAFILCGSCGFNNYPQDYSSERSVVIKPPEPKLKYPVIYMYCDNAQFCLALESALYFNEITSNVIISKTAESHNQAASLIATDQNINDHIQMIKAFPPSGVNVDLSQYIYEYSVNMEFKDQNGYTYNGDSYQEQSMMVYLHKKPKTKDRVDKIYLYQTDKLDLLYKSVANDLVSNLIRDYYTPR
jgi:hypothetical protein